MQLSCDSDMIQGMSDTGEGTIFLEKGDSRFEIRTKGKLPDGGRLLTRFLPL